MSKFFCDSNCELWWKIAEKMGAEVIKMPYTVGDDEYAYDLGKETNHKKFFERLKNKETPATQALNPYEYTQMFEPVLKSGQDIIYVHFSSNLSGTFNYMQTAIDELKLKYPDRKITTVDTFSISMGAGAIVFEALKMWKDGKSDEEIKEWVELNREKFATYFIVDDLNFLKRGGRLNSASAIIGTMLNVKPVLKVNEEGKIVPYKKVTGRKKAMKELIEIVKEIGENVADYPITILHACLEEEAEMLKKQLIEYLGVDAEIWVQPIGPTIGCHCGPNTLGIVFHSKRR